MIDVLAPPPSVSAYERICANIEHWFACQPEQTLAHLTRRWEEALAQSFRCTADFLAHLYLLALLFERRRSPQYILLVQRQIRYAEATGYLSEDFWPLLLHIRASQLAREPYACEERLWSYTEITILGASTGYRVDDFLQARF